MSFPSSLLLIGGCGYIGSRLYLDLKPRVKKLDTLDLELRGNAVNPDNIKMDYASADTKRLSAYDVILFFGGHSSVGQADADPQGALENNISHLFRLAQRLSPAQRLIYASSASVYNGITGAPADETQHNAALPNNAYDISKTGFDLMMEHYGRHFAGLRLGTLAGPSPKRRDDLVLNAMTKSALLEKKVHVFNGHLRRSMLGINDIVRAVRTLLEADTVEDGFYNLTSYDITIQELGEKVSQQMNVPLETAPDTTKVYDYLVSNKKFASSFNFAFTDTPEALIDEVAQEISKESR